jgi:hypothetical protein
MKTVTGVADADGDITAEYLFFFGGYTWNGLNAVSYEDAFLHGSTLFDYGADFIGLGQATSTGVGGENTPFAFAVICGGVGQGYSLIDIRPQLSFGGENQLLGYVSAVSAGTFTLTLDRNSRGSDYYMYLALSDVTIDLPTSPPDPALISNGTFTASGYPVGVINFPANTGFAAHGTGQATGAGGSYNGIGWSARDSNQGAAVGRIEGQHFETRVGVTLTDRCAAGLDTSGVLLTPAPTITWDALGFTVTGAASPLNYIPFIFSGTDIVARAGSEAQPITTGTQTIDLDCEATWVIMVGEGVVDGAGVGTRYDFSLGLTDGISQINFWTGQAGNGDGSGARWIGDAALLRFGAANGVSTTFPNVMEFVSLVGSTLTVDWTAVDGTARQWLWYAMGPSDVPPPPPPTPVYRTREVVRRRLRRAPIVWSEKGGLQTRVRINLFAVDMQPGVGTADTPDPLVMIRCSKDGGFTWGNERRLTAGRVGEFFERINAWQWGQGRDWVFEVACTDPVTWNLLGAYLDAEGGES